MSATNNNKKQELTFTVPQGQSIRLTIHIESIPHEVVEDAKPTLDSILNTVSTVCKVKMEDIMGLSRKEKFTIPRQMYFHIAHAVFEYSANSTGKLVNRDHSTVLAACINVRNMRTTKNEKYVKFLKLLQPFYSYSI